MDLSQEAINRRAIVYQYPDAAKIKHVNIETFSKSGREKRQKSAFLKQNR